jgi:hypothetical protein
MSLFLWVVPPNWISFKRRGSTLQWLDILGKWSIIDVFVLLMTLASFRLSIDSPDNLAFLPTGLYSINMLVVPLWGLYANMIGTSLTTCMRTWIVRRSSLLIFNSIHFNLLQLN